MKIQVSDSFEKKHMDKFNKPECKIVSSEMINWQKTKIHIDHRY